MSPLEPLLLRLRIVKPCYFHLKKKHNLSTIDWRDEDIVSSELFDEFRIGAYDPNAATTKYNALQNSSDPSKIKTTAKTSRSLASEFRRGIKREKSADTVLKDEKNWNSWKRRTIVTMYAHMCQNIANTNYEARTMDEILLPREQNNLMSDVFATILQTSTLYCYT